MAERRPTAVVVMPAYNEVGLAAFLAEIDEELRTQLASVRYVVVDDCSDNAVESDLLPLEPDLVSRVQVLRNERNLGHGPSAVRAYRAGMATGAEVVLHVDGDGQFRGTDIASVALVAAASGAAVGVRHSRTDPWFRTVLSCLARFVVGTSDGNWDVNSPLRAYQPELLKRLLDRVDDETLVPHLHFARSHPKIGISPVPVSVMSLPRRGDDPAGTTWGPQRRFARVIPSTRLVSFALRALLEFRPRASALRGRVSLDLADDAAANEMVR